MTVHRTFEDLAAEGASIPTEGWDVSWFEGRATEARPSWGQATSAAARLGRASVVLGIQTGGGEVLDFALAQAPKRPPLAATEGWPPNVAKATAPQPSGRSGNSHRTGGRHRRTRWPALMPIFFVGDIPE